MQSEKAGQMPTMFHAADKKMSDNAPPSLQRILLFIFTKYIVFNIIQMFFSGDYAFIQPDIALGEDLYLYLWIFFSTPVLVALLFTIPLQKGLAASNKYLTALVLVAFSVGEYFLFTFYTNADPFQSVRNSLLTVAFLWLFFWRDILAAGRQPVEE